MWPGDNEAPLVRSTKRDQGSEWIRVETHDLNERQVVLRHSAVASRHAVFLLNLWNNRTKIWIKDAQILLHQSFVERKLPPTFEMVSFQLSDLRVVLSRANILLWNFTVYVDVRCDWKEVMVCISPVDASEQRRPLNRIKKSRRLPKVNLLHLPWSEWLYPPSQPSWARHNQPIKFVPPKSGIRTKYIKS